MTRQEAGQAAYSAGLRMFSEISHGLIRWAASRYSEPPPWWPELAPLSPQERTQVWAQLAAKSAREVQEARGAGPLPVAPEEPEG